MTAPSAPSALPKCPLSRHEPKESEAPGEGRESLVLQCPDPDCGLGQDAWFTESEWRRLAAPLAPEVVALVEVAGEVLASIPGTYDENDPTVIRHATALNALAVAWIRYVEAGRPGLVKP